jgi:hypothetical protein
MAGKSRLEALKEKKARIHHRIQMLETRHKAKERKQETRRKILIGAYYLDKANEAGNIEEIKKIMDGYLTRDIDRQLFDLSPKETKKSK